MPFNADLQIAGVRDDGSEAGVVRAEVVGGEFVAIPFVRGAYYAEVSSGSVVNFSSGGIAENGDGSNCGLYVNIAADGYGAVWFPFYGRSLGVRFRSSTSPFAVSVDGGDVVRVSASNYLSLEMREPAQNTEARQITHRDLGEGPHFGRMVFSGSASGVVCGLLVERNAGYVSPTRTALGSDSSAAAVPTSPEYISPTCGLGSSTPMRFISKAVYSNPTASAITLTWFAGGASTVCLSKSIAPGDLLSLDFAMPLASSTVRQQASSPGLVAFFLGGIF